MKAIDTIAIAVLFLLALDLYRWLMKRWLGPSRNRYAIEGHGIDVSPIRGKVSRLKHGRGHFAQHRPAERARKKTLIATARTVVANFQFFRRDEERQPIN